MIAPPLRPTVPQLHQLTGLRGLAAWFVVLYHIRLSMSGIVSTDAIRVLGKGYLAVDLFFMLSGFVMWLNYGHRLRGHGWRATADFWWKRIARIWPLHLLVLAGMVAFALVLVMTERSTDMYPFAELPMHLVLIQNWGFTDQLSWNHPAWSISTELAAYLLFPAFVAALHWNRIGTGGLFAIAALLIALLHGVFAYSGHRELGQDIAKLGLIRCLIEFAVGALLCMIWQRWSRAGARIAFAAGGMCMASVAAGLWLRAPETAFVPLALASGLLALALSGGVIAKLFSSSPMRWLGDLSYATYLTHFFLFILFKIAVVGADGQLTLAQCAAFLAIVLIVSAALHYRFERPAQKWLVSRMPYKSAPSAGDARG